MKKGKQAKQDLVITTLRAPREFWVKVRTRALVEGLSMGAFVLKVLAEYLDKKPVVAWWAKSGKKGGK